jgi:hypothetical protein
MRGGAPGGDYLSRDRVLQGAARLETASTGLTSYLRVTIDETLAQRWSHGPGGASPELQAERQSSNIAWYTVSVGHGRRGLALSRRLC